MNRELPRTDIKTKLLVLRYGCGDIATRKIVVKVPAKMYFVLESSVREVPEFLPESLRQFAEIDHHRDTLEPFQRNEVKKGSWSKYLK